MVSISMNSLDCNPDQKGKAEDTYLICCRRGCCCDCNNRGVKGVRLRDEVGVGGDHISGGSSLDGGHEDEDGNYIE